MACSITLHIPPTGDWCVCIDEQDRTIYEGPCQLNPLSRDLLDYLGIEYEEIVYDSDEEYQETFG